MGTIAITMFGGITVLAVALDARANPDGNPSVISQIAASVFGGSSVLFYLFQAATAGILILAANTAFNGFPLLASILGRDRYLPRQLRLCSTRPTATCCARSRRSWLTCPTTSGWPAKAGSVASPSEMPPSNFRSATDRPGSAGP